MPTYDYECQACGNQMEVFQGINDAVLTKCPKCKKNKLERLFGGGGAIIFKGGGFYETDYRRAGETAGKGEGKTEGEGKSDAKETKADAPAATAQPGGQGRAERVGEEDGEVDGSAAELPGGGQHATPVDAGHRRSRRMGRREP